MPDPEGRGWAGRDLAGCKVSIGVNRDCEYLPDVVLGMDFPLDCSTEELEPVELSGWQVKEDRDK